MDYQSDSVKEYVLSILKLPYDKDFIFIDSFIILC